MKCEPKRSQKLETFWLLSYFSRLIIKSPKSKMDLFSLFTDCNKKSKKFIIESSHRHTRMLVNTPSNDRYIQEKVIITRCKGSAPPSKDSVGVCSTKPLIVETKFGGEHLRNLDLEIPIRLCLSFKMDERVFNL